MRRVDPQMVRGAGRGGRGGQLRLTIAYCCILLALAAFGAGRVREIMPRILAGFAAIEQHRRIAAATRSAYLEALKRDAPQPRPNPVLPHRIAFYPPLAIRRHQEGDVVMRLLVRPDGLVGDAEVVKSSGYPQLDAVALTSVGSWAYIPAVRHHHPVAAWIQVRIRFHMGPAPWPNAPVAG